MRFAAAVGAALLFEVAFPFDAGLSSGSALRRLLFGFDGSELLFEVERLSEVLLDDMVTSEKVYTRRRRLMVVIIRLLLYNKMFFV